MQSLGGCTRLRHGAVLSLAAGAAIVVGAHLCETPSTLVHMVVLPVFLAYAALFRPDWLRRISARHVLYFVVLAALVAGYLLATVRTSPALEFHWSELPLALWFLGSVHVVVGLADGLVNALLSPVFRLARPARRPWYLYVPKTVLRLAAVLALAGPYLAATFMTHWVRLTDTTDPRGQLGRSCEEVRFASTSGAGLVGWFAPAPQRPSDATVILVGGTAQLRSSMLSYARMVGEGGYNVFFFDLRSGGGGAGHTQTFGLTKAKGVLGALRYLKRARPAQSRHVFAFGIGHGAGAVTAAAALDGRIQAVVLDSALVRQDPALERLASLLPGPIGRYFRGATLLLASAEVGCDLFRGGADGDLARLGPRPVMLVQGREDALSPPEEGQRLCASVRGPATLWLVPEAGHAEAPLFAWDEYRNRVRELFESVRHDLPAPPEAGEG